MTHPMPFETVTRAAFTVVGITTRTAADPPTEIGRLWGQFVAEDVAARIPHCASPDVYSVYTDYEGDHTRPYTVLLGCAVTRVDALPPGLVARTVPAGRYAVLAGVAARPEAIGAAWGQVYAAALPRAYTADFDLHHAEGPRAGTVDVHVALADAGGPLTAPP
jgi:predicted transcriptional regulator YdeE